MNYNLGRAMCAVASATRRKLLILSATAEIGGTERVVLTIGEVLSRRGVDVEVVLPECDTSGEVLDWFRSAGVRAESSGTVRSLEQSHTLSQMLRFSRFVRESGATVVNLHYGGNHISLKDVLFTRMAGKRCVVQVHHAESIAEPHKRRMTALAGRLATAVVVTTPVLRELLVNAGVPRARIHVVPCGVPGPDRRPGRQEARRSLGIPPDAFVIGSLARLVPSKGMTTLVEAVAGMPAPGDDVHLVIAGDGPDRERIRCLGEAALGERLHLLGRIERPSDLYASCDLFALASRSEGLGLVFIEAALQGVPSVAMDVGGVRYAVLDGETGLLAPLDDVPAFREAMQRLRADGGLRERLGTCALAHASEEHGLERMADRYAEVLGL
jgi:glycosyltransferase involved in cell wall biosynthesis